MSGNFPYQELRSLLLEYLDLNPIGNFTSAVTGVVELAKKHRLYSGSKTPLGYVGGPSYDSGPGDFQSVPEIVRQLLWQFLVQGILVFGKSDNSPNWPWYRITIYGKNVLRNKSPQPHDPDGFLREFTAINPTADRIVYDYLEEAVHALNTGCFKASAVMLGCASEQLILILHEVFAGAIQDPKKRKAFSKSYRWTIYSKFNRLRSGLESMIETGKLPRELHEAVRSDLVSGFELIRRHRNSGGHPDIPSNIRRETIFLNLTFFPEYARQVLQLIEYFKLSQAEP